MKVNIAREQFHKGAIFYDNVFGLVGHSFEVIPDVNNELSI